MKGITRFTSVIFGCHLLVSGVAAIAQDPPYPELDKIVPAFALKTDPGSDQKELTSENLTGKFYILDFWNTACALCIRSFPKVDSLQRMFGNKVQLILVGQEERRRNVKDFYEVYRKRFGMGVASYFDSVAYRKFVHFGTPHLVWVNDKGIVKAITASAELTAENIQRFVTGGNFVFIDRSYKGGVARENRFDIEKPLLIDGNGGGDQDYIFRSILSIWNQENGPPTDQGMPQSGGIGRYQVLGMPIGYLYAVAFFGNVNYTLTPDAIFEPVFSKEASEILKNRFGEGTLFNYSVEMPQEVATRSRIMRKMQDDLSALLGLEANVSLSQVPCFKLQISDPTKLSAQIAANSEKRSWSWNPEDSIHKFHNISLAEFLNILRSKILDLPTPIFENSADTFGRYNFRLSAQVNDLQSIRQGIQQLGLSLTPSTKQVQIIKVTAGQ